MNDEFWGLLHDGAIEAIRGEIQGVVSIEISVRYLRDQFPGAGTGFRVDLRDCGELVYKEYDSPPLTDFEAIVASAPEIVGVEVGTPVVIHCVMGILTLSYRAASISLDTGERVTFDELAAASKAYWDAWAARIPAKK